MTATQAADTGPAAPELDIDDDAPGVIDDADAAGDETPDTGTADESATSGRQGDLRADLLAPVRELGAFIRAQRTQAQVSLRALADKAGVSNPYLSQVERGLRRPSAAILNQIADGLSISAETLLVKAGVLKQRETPTDVTAAIRADGALTERQKTSLIEIYRAFVRGNGKEPT